MRKGNSLSLLDVDEVPLLPFANNISLKKQVEKGLAINVLRNEQWGGYYHIPLNSNVKTQNVELTAKETNFNALKWIEMSTVSEENRVQVRNHDK